MSDFGIRLLEAFDTSEIAVLSRKLGITYQAAKNYVDGRLPSADRLIEISRSTNRSIDWLLTGKDCKTQAAPNLNPEMLDRLRTIAREQTQMLYLDLDIAAANLAEKTFVFLTEYLIYRSMVSLNLIESGDLLSSQDLKRAERFTFLTNIPQSLDDRITDLVRQEVAKERRLAVRLDVGSKQKGVKKVA